MHNGKESYYRVALVAVLSLLSFVGVTLEIRSPLSISPVAVLDPFFLLWSREVSKAEKEISSALEILRYWEHWEEERERLLRERDDLLVRLHSTQEALRENQELKRLLKLKRDLPYPAIAAHLVCKGGTPWSPTFLLDKGERDGVKRGMAVVTPHGVVGVVVATSPHTSRVLGITSVDCKIHVEDQKSKVRGILEGDNAGGLLLRYILTDREVKPGDLLLTSGLGGIFPRGYPVAKVTEVKRLPGEKFLFIKGRPTASWDDTHYLLVLKWGKR